ncbi:hypothetical protein R5R35_003848 [Gryllus longicercus]|uniref:Lysophospholipid acyltransferase 5 n=1 Tax=Gryllus longicercus TaxID=2509291 RepID=A0AAN9VLU5_9ORTH
MAVQSSILSRTALALGATEPALRLLLSILIAYPLAFVHRYFLYGKKPMQQHIFFCVSGLLIGYFNYGNDILHALITVGSTYVILVICGGTLASVCLVFGFTMGYLLMGYYYTGTETYDIKWSMPQCVLTLRLIGLAYDLYDGQKPTEELSAEQKKMSLKSFPSFLEVAGHTFFPSSFLVGPQFPMQRYLNFVHGRHTVGGALPDSISHGLQRFGAGCFYLALFQLGTSFYPDNYLISESFDESTLVYKCFVLAVWGKVTLYKYISCWLISEGGCIITGITYSGNVPPDPNTEPKWDGCANVILSVFEGASRFGHFIASFNTNTNHWVAYYVYKRLKFLGNRFISQAVALLFLAIWHGFHSGYYVCFLLEFIVMVMEKDLEPKLINNRTVKKFLEDPKIVPFVWVILKLYTLVFMGYCLVPFALLSFAKWWQVYKSVYFIGHLFFGLWPLYGRFVKRFLSSIDVRD